MRRNTAVFAAVSAGLLAAGLPAVKALSADRPAAKPGLCCHYYANRDFWKPVGTCEIRSLHVDMPLKRLRGPWSMAAYGSIQVPRAGLYRFYGTGCPAELLVGDVRVTLDGQRGVMLRVGRAPLRLYAKAKPGPHTTWNATLDVTWRGPGMRAHVAIDPALLSHDEADTKRAKVFHPQVRLAKPRRPVFNWREYDIDVPQDGFYEMAGHFQGTPSTIDMTLDGAFLYFHMYRASRVRPRFGFLNTAGAVRWLAKGKHTVGLYLSRGAYTWENTDKYLKDTVFGVTRMPDSDPVRARSITVPGRDDLVFRKGERFVVRVEQATRDAETYRLEVLRQRAGDTIVWTGTAALAANTPHATGEIAYPCDTQGAFECVLRDRFGERVAGPWAFVVVDTTPVARPKASDPPPKVKRVLVDRVDCTLPDDREHQFRDNGTSQVVHGPAGKYRVTPRRHSFRRHYHKVKDGVWRVAREGESVNATYTVQDWFAYTMKVKHPGRTHLVVAWIPTDVRRLVVVQAYDHVTGHSNAALLEVGDNPNEPALAPLSFLVWPNSKALDVTSFCSESQWYTENRQGAVARIELYEYPDGLPALPMPAGGVAKDKHFGWKGEQVDIGMEQRMMPRRSSRHYMMPGVYRSTDSLFPEAEIGHVENVSGQDLRRTQWVKARRARCR